jgi:hypothetical protein
MLSYFIDHYKHKQNVIIGGSNASNRSSTSLMTLSILQSQHDILNFFTLFGLYFRNFISCPPSEKGFSEGTYENFVLGRRAGLAPTLTRKNPCLTENENSVKIQWNDNSHNCGESTPFCSLDSLYCQLTSYL